jgi:cellulose synthase/poly-beta-1,6-N-acetylglucosamine synthase-like glycosyltransferase
MMSISYSKDISIIISVPSLSDITQKIPTKKITICDLATEIDYVYTGVRTKPNALNVGLRNAKGSLLTIYDAEDRPDPAQLRKVAAYMIEHPGVACVQSRLMYYNPDQSIITKFFTIEYIQQFLVLLPSLFSMNKILLLGGTSNFFRTEVLRDLNGWDPNNVTEDADLGIRLSKMGYGRGPFSNPVKYCGACFDYRFCSC